jgi:hypothetical protein
MSRISFKEFFGSGYYFFFSCVLSIPVWLATNTYVKTLRVDEDEAVSTALTTLFFIGIFTGRYIAQYWTVKRTDPPKSVLIWLSVAIVACFIWLFFHADFPLKGRASINLLLYWLPFLAISLLIGILVKFVRAITQKQLTEARSDAAQSRGELRLLQSQLSPHFLFNTLNNLYGLSLTQHQKIPPLLLRLSDLLRYSVYEAGETFVPLKNEVEYINNYIEFEKIRLGDRLVLTTSVETLVSTDIKIAPMLLIVFIENAFKHSKNTAASKLYIDINLESRRNLISFYIKNSHQKASTKSQVNEHSGMGLTNVYKRLELLYPGEHILEILDEDEWYSVTLQLKIKK